MRGSGGKRAEPSCVQTAVQPGGWEYGLGEKNEAGPIEEVVFPNLSPGLY